MRRALVGKMRGLQFSDCQTGAAAPPRGRRSAAAARRGPRVCGRSCARSPVPPQRCRRHGAPPWPPAGARGGGDMGEKPTPPEGRQRPHAARHGPKRAGAQPGRSGRRPRTPPPARPERPEAARPPGKAAGTAGARHGGDPRKRPGPQAGPSAAARLRKHPRTEKRDARAARGTTGRKRTPGAPTSRGCRPRRAAHPAKRARGARRARAAEGEPPRLARPAGRATRKKGGPRRSGARANRAARRPDRRRFLFARGGATLAPLRAADGKRGRTPRSAKQGAALALTQPPAVSGFPCGMSERSERPSFYLILGHYSVSRGAHEQECP